MDFEHHAKFDSISNVVPLAICVVSSALSLPVSNNPEHEHAIEIGVIYCRLVVPSVFDLAFFILSLLDPVQW